MAEGRPDREEDSSEDEIESDIHNSEAAMLITEDGACYKDEILVKDIVGDNILNPSGRDDVAWCVVRKDSKPDNKEMFGKWLVFKDYDQLNAIWSEIVMALREGKLADCCMVKSSTLLYNPDCAGPGPTTNGVIGVYTLEKDIETIGYKLIQIVKQDIKYKTEECTLNYKYAHMGAVSTIKTLYYNQGQPSTELIGERCIGSTKHKDDVWHINEVVSSSSGTVYGRWILTLEYKELTHLWHLLKRKIENGQLKALKMVCPRKKQRSSCDEKPVFHVHTIEENVRVVGAMLIMEVSRDIKYEKKSGNPHYRTLYWNEGEYAYDKITR